VNIMVPVDVLCEGCVKCPRLNITGEKEYDRNGKTIKQEFECVHLDECITVKEAIERKGRDGHESADDHREPGAGS